MKKHCLFIIVLILCVSISAAASTRQTQIYTFQHDHITFEDAGIFAYLEQARNSEAVKVQNRNACMSTTCDSSSLYFLRDIIFSLAKSSDPKAFLSLSRCVSQPWPIELTREIAEAAMNGYYRSSADIDRRLIDLQMKVRSTCAEALATFNNPEARAHVVQLINAIKPLIDKELRKTKPDHSLLWSFSTIANALSAMGDKTGIDSIITVIDRVPLESPEVLVSALTLATGQKWGPHYSQPRHRQAEDIERWQAFWKKNRDTFVIDVDAVKTEKYLTPSVTSIADLRDALFVLSHRYGYPRDSGILRKQSLEWLEKQGRKQPWRLLLIADDPSEFGTVRETALRYYAEFEEKKALPVLRDYALLSGNARSLGRYAPFVQSQALLQVCKLSANECLSLSQQSLLSRDEVVSTTASRILLENPKTREIAAQSFSKLSFTAKQQSVQFFLSLQDNCPYCRKVFHDALMDSEPAIAIHGLHGIIKADGWKALTAAEQNALERLYQRPEFAVSVLMSGSSEIGLSLRDLDAMVSKTWHQFFIAPYTLPAVIEFLKEKQTTLSPDSAELHESTVLQQKAEGILAQVKARILNRAEVMFALPISTVE